MRDLHPTVVGMETNSDSTDLDSRRDAVEADQRAVEEHLRAVMGEVQLVPADTTEGSRLRAEASRLREERQRLTDEADRIARRSVAAVTNIESERDRRRIALQILAVVVPWRDALPNLDFEQADLFRVRGHALLNYLDVAVMPYPELQDALAAARAELG